MAGTTILKNVRLAHNTFLAYCVELFGNDNGNKVYYFYRYAMKNIAGRGGLQSEKQRKNLDNMLTLVNHNYELFLDTVFHIVDNYENSTCRNQITENYFRACLNNKINGAYKPSSNKDISTAKSFSASNKTITKANQSGMNIKSTRLIEPVQYLKTRDNYSDDYLNWDYKCSCGMIIDPWKDNCPQCNAKLNWSSFI